MKRQRPEAPKPAPRIIPAWHPAPWDKADAGAIQALGRGDASKEQQIRALRWIVEQAAATHDQPFRPGEDGRRDTDFACGRLAVGSQIRKLLIVNIQALKD